MRLLPLFITSLAFVVVGCSRHNAPAPASDQTALKVRTARIETVNLLLTQALPATIHPLERATLAAPAAGSVLPVQLDPDSDPLNAELVEFSAAADPLTQTRLAKLELPQNSAVRSGQFVRVLWPIGTAPTLLIPASAVQHFGQMERVFVVTSEGRTQLRLVKTATHSTALTRILAGLTAGETIILNPAATLRDGQSVIVSP